MTITVTGVKEATSTGVETIEGIQVYSCEGVVYVYTPEEKQVIIVAMNGILKASEKQIGKRRYELPRGFYIVWIEGETFKVANWFGVIPSQKIEADKRIENHSMSGLKTTR